MKNDITQIQDNFIEMAGNICASANITRIIGQLYALLYMSEEPVSMDGIVDRLDVSKGNVSVNISILERWGAVRKVWVKGSRKNYYMAEPDIWRIIKDRVKEGVERRVEITTTSINSVKKSLEEFESKSTKEEKQKISFYKTRLEEVDKLSNRLKDLLKFIS